MMVSLLRRADLAIHESGQQRPRHRFRQRQRPLEVVEAVGKGVQLKTNIVGP